MTRYKRRTFAQIVISQIRCRFLNAPTPNAPMAFLACHVAREQKFHMGDSVDLIHPNFDSASLIEKYFESSGTSSPNSRISIFDSLFKACAGENLGNFASKH